jgi:Bacterial Ig domain/Cellulase (glycosyl hydrolase family 5)
MTVCMDAAANSTRASSALLSIAALILVALFAIATPASGVPPVEVTITTPRDGATISSRVPWLAEVSGNAKTVDFYIDDELEWTEHREPFVYNGDGSDGSLDTAELGDGRHELKVVANHPSGTTATAVVNVTVANQTAPAPAPAVSIASPANGASLSGTVSWEAATDGDVTRVLFFVDGVQKWVENAAPYRFNGDGNFDTTTIANGSHVLAVRAEGPGGSSNASINVTAANGSSGGSTGSPSLPVNTAVPTVSGTASVGQTLSATTGTWTGTAPISYTRSWERCVNGTCTAISGATGATYTLVSGDNGATLRHVVTATNSLGSAVARSAETAKVQAGSTTPPANVELPLVSGTAMVARQLGASPGSWSGSTPMTYAYQWLRCDSTGGNCGSVTGATAASYTLVTADQGHRMRVAVAASNSAGAQVSTSAATDVVVGEPVAPAPQGLPAVGIAAGADLQSWPLADVNRQLDDYRNLHAGWIRHDFSWDVIEPQRGTFRWAGYDALVNAARSRGIGVIATVTYTPAWANGGFSDHNYAPASADEFGRFAGDVARRYAGQGVHHYEIWNEPNIGYWKPLPDPARYTAVLRAAATAIRAADPLAVIITGGASPAGNSATTFEPQTWLSRLYANGAKPYFDAVGYHPYVDDDGFIWDVMADRPTNLRQIMTANGDAAKRIHATEVGCNRNAVSDCSTRLVTAFSKWKSYSWAGVLAWFIYWDPNVYGLVDGNWNRRPLWYAYQQAASSAG